MAKKKKTKKRKKTKNKNPLKKKIPERQFKDFYKIIAVMGKKNELTAWNV